MACLRSSASPKGTLKHRRWHAAVWGLPSSWGELTAALHGSTWLGCMCLSMLSRSGPHRMGVQAWRLTGSRRPSSTRPGWTSLGTSLLVPSGAGGSSPSGCVGPCHTEPLFRMSCRLHLLQKWGSRFWLITQGHTAGLAVLGLYPDDVECAVSMMSALACGSRQRLTHLCPAHASP